MQTLSDIFLLAKRLAHRVFCTIGRIGDMLFTTMPVLTDEEPSLKSFLLWPKKRYLKHHLVI